MYFYFHVFLPLACFFFFQFHWIEESNFTPQSSTGSCPMHSGKKKRRKTQIEQKKIYTRNLLYSSFDFLFLRNLYLYNYYYIKSVNLQSSDNTNNFIINHKIILLINFLVYLLFHLLYIDLLHHFLFLHFFYLLFQLLFLYRFFFVFVLLLI